MFDEHHVLTHDVIGIWQPRGLLRLIVHHAMDQGYKIGERKVVIEDLRLFYVILQFLYLFEVFHLQKSIFDTRIDDDGKGVQTGETIVQSIGTQPDG